MSFKPTCGVEPERLNVMQRIPYDVWKQLINLCPVFRLKTVCITDTRSGSGYLLPIRITSSRFSINIDRKAKKLFERLQKSENPCNRGQLGYLKAYLNKLHFIFNALVCFRCLAAVENFYQNLCHKMLTAKVNLFLLC